jgi:hypothetical protein
VTFEDQSSKPPARFSIENANLVVTDISTKQGSMWPLEASATIEGEATGFIKGAFGAAPLNAEVEVGLENFQLAKYQP